MADNPDNTKAAFDKNWASATEVGEYVTQSNEGAWVLAPTDIRTALLGGCPAVLELDQGGQKNYAVPPDPTSDPTSSFWFPPDRLRWVNALNPSMRREDFFDRPWPWELRAYLSPSEPWEFRDIEGRPIAREQVRSTLRVFLHRAEAIQWGLLPSPQAPPTEPSRAEPVAELASVASAELLGALNPGASSVEPPRRSRKKKRSCRKKKRATRGGVQPEPASRVETTKSALPAELPSNASAADQIAWAYLRLRVDAPEQLRLRGDARRRAVYKRIASNFTAGRSSWTRAMKKVRDYDRQQK
jgi:hypothetical protein